MRRSKRTAVGAAATGLGMGVAAFALASSAEAVPTAADAANAASAVGTASSAARPTIDWQPCPQYSDDVLQYLHVQPADMAAWRANWARTDCGTVSVPLDYEHPKGEHITVALTRLRAKDAAHRLGSLAMNPGGPGGSGYLMPARFMQENPSIAALNNQYDLIGFDPRGIGYSTSYDCVPSTPPSGPPPSGQLTEAEFNQRYDGAEKDNAACSSSNPEFLGRLTTANAARDLDQIRRGLGEKKMSFFGASWGTQLGAVYRSMFPDTIGRMWLDSVVSPKAYDLRYRFDFTAGSTEQRFHRYAAWLAARNSEYGLGDTAAKVEARILGLVQNADAQPWQYTNFPVPVDGALIGSFAAADDTMWEPAALVLKALATAAHSGPAPQALLDAVHLVDGPPPPGPAGAPKAFDTTAANAYLCNEDTSPRDFSSQWAEYRRNLRENPVTGDTDAQRPSCAGWSLPVQSFELRRSSGSLQLSGHLHENVTPYPWAEQMQDAIGGTVFTVKDSVHGSMPFVADCAAHITAYFDTGKADSGTCRGEPPVHLPAADGTA